MKVFGRQPLLVKIPTFDPVKSGAENQMFLIIKIHSIQYAAINNKEY